jgi:hypothetical protein
MDDGCRPMGIFTRYRELASGIEKVACFRGLDEVICSLRPQYENGVIEILEIATECHVVILTEAGFSKICEIDDSKGKMRLQFVDDCRHNLVYGETCSRGRVTAVANISPAKPTSPPLERAANCLPASEIPPLRSPSRASRVPSAKGAGCFGAENRP